MTKRRHSEAQIIPALKQVEADRTAKDVAREQGVSKQTIYINPVCASRRIEVQTSQEFFCAEYEIGLRGKALISLGKYAVKPWPDAGANRDQT